MILILYKDFNKEQEEFIKTNKKTGPIKPPWVGFKDEEQLKEQILQLSKDKRNFLRAPPAGAQFEFDYQVLNRYFMDIRILSFSWHNQSHWRF